MSSTTTIATIDAGTALAGPFTMRSDGIGTTVAPCFCAGTRLRTPWGEIPVEALAPGDEVETLHGGRQRIAWTGRRTYDGRFIAGRHLMLPVTLRAGSIAPGVPARDLRVSPGHAVWVDGLLIPAWRLVNNVNIVQARRVARVAYVHIELPRHELVLAEGCPAESFYDDVCRGQFHTCAGTIPPPTAPLPRCASGFALEAVRARLAARAGVAGAPPPGPLRGVLDQAGPAEVAGWAQDETDPERPVVLEVLRAGRRFAWAIANIYRPDLRAAGLGSGCHGFCLPLLPGAGEITVQRALDKCRLPALPLPGPAKIA